ncbi:MAG TPA: hypothetical protein HA247_04215 [Candidatus Thalassarchaeaceae archaeon]|nr:hypothetical protein [Candidatus Thalassarchaeaceae archaeon]
MKCRTGVVNVRMIKTMRKSVDHGGMLLPMERKRDHPMMINTQGRYLRENSDNRALATSSV